MDVAAPEPAVESIPPDDRAQRIATRLLTLLDEDGPGALAIAASSLRAADIAAVMAVVSERQRVQVFCGLPPDLAGQVLEELRPELRDQLLESSDDQHLAKILAEADADDAIYFLDHLDDERAAKLLSQLDAKLRAQLEEQYEANEETAGRIMSREIVTLRSFLTAAQAIAHLQALRNDEAAHNFSTLYVVDAEARLVGVLPFRQLIFAPPRACLTTLMDRDIITATPDTDREKVARMMQKYHLLTVPVVDTEGRIRGIVTWDDAVDVLEAEAEEDLLAIAGTSETPEDNDSLLKRASLRMPWLLITALGGFINAKIIAGYGYGLKEQMILIGFMPLVCAMGGNIGLQCSTVTVRNLATGAIGPGRGLASVGREVGTGFLLAVAMSIICGIGGTVVAYTSGYSPIVGAIMATSLLLVVVMASLFGVIVPLTCQRCHFDPALAAGPFITMLNDVGGNLVYITTVYAMLRLF
ncbi:MAG: magnesium transporter [Planctomycetes bacterium]|nr:magnesium transporter [Planctomycetota bacterium]